MIKSKFGGSVRSKLPIVQVNDVLAKVLCPNLACIIHAITEFGIDVDCTKPAPVPAAQPQLTPVRVASPARPVLRLVPPRSSSRLERLK